MGNPRRHHYVTKEYLTSFCTEGKKTFWGYDIKRAKWRISQPINEAVERDFQKLDHFIALDPYYLEKEFGKIEGQAVEVIRKIALDKRIPSSLEEFSPVINLMGIFAGRNIVTRTMINEMYQKTSLATLELIHKDENTYYNQMKKAVADGALDEPIIPYHESKAFLDSKKFEIRTDPSIIVEELAKLVVTLVDLLWSRNWMLAEAEGSQFITSNKPVNPIWSMGFIKLAPGFGLINSLITFPLTPDLALIGSWSPLPAHKRVGPFIVEGIN